MRIIYWEMMYFIMSRDKIYMFAGMVVILPYMVTSLSFSSLIRVEKNSPRPCRRWILFYPTTPSQWMKYCMHLAALSLFQWIVFRRTTVPPVPTFTAKTHHATRIVANHPHYLHILRLRCKFHSSSLFPANRYFVEPIPKRVFLRSPQS